MITKYLGRITELPAPSSDNTVNLLLLEDKEKATHNILKTQQLETGQDLWIDIYGATIADQTAFKEGYPNGADAMLIILEPEE